MAYNKINLNTVSKFRVTRLKDVRLHSFMHLEKMYNRIDVKGFWGWGTVRGVSSIWDI